MNDENAPSGPSEEELVKRALAQPHEDKYRRSIGLLQMYSAVALRTTGKPIYLAFSGGKDSCVLKQLAIEADIPFEAYYNQTTIDPPELIDFIRKHHADVPWNKPKMPLLRRLVQKTSGPPTRRGAWCCEEYKECYGKGYVQTIGVRIAESPRRKKLWKEFQRTNNSGEATLAPIVYWTNEDIWKFIKDRNLPYCSLYDEGFDRLGCVGCPRASAANRDRDFKRWPGYERAWQKAIFACWERWKDVPTRKGEERWFAKHKTAESLWNWWLHGDRRGYKHGCAYEETMSNR